MENRPNSEYANPYSLADSAGVSERVSFIRRTYLHLALAILAFVGVETLIQMQPWAGSLAVKMTSGMMWFVVLGAFMGVSWIADKWASSGSSRGIQYLGLGFFIVAEAFIFLPLLYKASMYAPAAPGELGVIGKAGVVTLFIFAGLTATVLITKKDFSFMRGFLVVGGFVALGVIVCGMIFGFNLGLWFSGAMALFASIAILYNTSNVLHHYRTDQHVAASLSLFSSVALLFWYILRIFMSRD